MKKYKNEDERILDNFPIVEVHISEIVVGDTIHHTDGKVRTVGRVNLQRGGFMGDRLFGDSYRYGYLLVKKVIPRK